MSYWSTVFPVISESAFNVICHECNKMVIYGWADEQWGSDIHRSYYCTNSLRKGSGICQQRCNVQGYSDAPNITIISQIV